MKAVAAEGAADRSVHTLSENFSIPLALALGGGPMAIGVLAAVPRLAGAVGQLFAPSAIAGLRSYRKVLLLAAVISALAFGAVAAVPWMPEAVRVPLLVVLVSVGIGALEFPTPALGCWVSDQVPARKRGSYMAWRHGLAAGATIAVLLLGGPFLDTMQGKAVVGLAGLFGVAGALRLFAAGMFMSMTDRAMPERVAKPTFGMFRDTLRKTNLGRFLTYSALMHFGTFLAAPYFTPYQLDLLGFSYSGLLFPVVVMTIAGLIGVHVFGRMADRMGNLNLLRGAAFAMPIIPLLWMFVSTPVHAAGLNIVTGLGWAAFNLCSLNFVLEVSRDHDRANNIAFLFFVNGTALFLGAMTGAVLFPIIPELLGSQYHAIFAASCVLRLAPAVFILPFVREVRRRRTAVRMQPTVPTVAGPALAPLLSVPHVAPAVVALVVAPEPEPVLTGSAATAEEAVLTAA